MKQTVNETKIDFASREAKRREEFYKTHNLETTTKTNEFKQSLTVKMQEGEQMPVADSDYSNELPKNKGNEQDGHDIDIVE